MLVDSCVWHHSFSRNVLRHLALASAIRIRWSRAIETEWIASVLHARPDITRDKLIEVRNRFRHEFPDGLVPEALPRLAVPRLPDPDDEHVVRAALVAEATVICTLDRRGFPRSALAPLGVTAHDPATLLATCVLQRMPQTYAGLHTHRTSLTQPSYHPREYLDALRKAGLVLDTAIEGLIMHGLKHAVSGAPAPE